MRYVYLGDTNNQGLSELLNKSYDGKTNIFDNSLKDYVDEVKSFFPEYTKQSVVNPQFLRKEVIFTINKDAHLNISFLDEGAGYLNSFGYIIFPTNKIPSTVNDLGDLIVVFPNASKSGAGGSMKIGDTIQLASKYKVETKNGKNIAIPTDYVFPKGYSVAFFLVANGWTSGKVGSGYNKFYSISSLNPEKTENLRYHLISRQSAKNNELVYLGFEDLRRDSNSDEDFNDCLFSVKCNPFDALSSGSYIPNIKENNPPEKYVIGYKKVFAKKYPGTDDQTVCEVLATLRIPLDAKYYAMPTDFNFGKSRKWVTNQAYVESLCILPQTHQRWNSDPFPAVGKTVTEAHSWADEKFVYQLHNWVYEELESNQKECGKGIYYWDNYNAAATWNPPTGDNSKEEQD